MEEQDLDGTATLDHYKPWVDELCARVEQSERKLTEIEHFSISTSKKKQGKPPSKHVPGLRKHLLEASRREAASAKRMHDLMRNFGTILNQITRHKWAWPFMQPVDVEGLGLDDYFEVIDKPMDFGTIKNQMEAKDGTGYRHVRQICADVRLVFDNATRYNEEKSNVHAMAKTLLHKFEEKWLQFLPKVVEEEARREAEEAEARLKEQLVVEAACGKMAQDLSRELCEIDSRVDELRERVVRSCRKFSVEEKRRLGAGLARLSPEDLSRILAIVAESDRGFQAAAEVVELDINAQTEAMLWRLKFFVKDALEVQGTGSGLLGENGISVSRGDQNEKREREISKAIVRAGKKRSKVTGS